MSILKVWIQTLLLLAAGTYFLLTSVYCLLAFLPYTYCAFVKAPPYPWMPWFTHHQAVLFWTASLSATIGNWPPQKSGRNRVFFGGVLLMASAVIYVTARPFLPTLQDDPQAYWWSLAALIALAGISMWRSTSSMPTRELTEVNNNTFGYSLAVLVAFAVSAVYVLGNRLHIYDESGRLNLHWRDAEIATWSLVSHVVLALAVLSALNLVILLAARTAKPRTVGRVLIGVLIAASLFAVLTRFLDNAMSFDGWAAYAYAGGLASALTLWGFALVLPHLVSPHTVLPHLVLPELDAQKISVAQPHSGVPSVANWAAFAGLIVLALASRWLIGGEDWNGFVGSTWALVFWIGTSLCVYRMRPARTNYSVPVIVGTLLVSAFVYKSLQLTEIFWARTLGSTDDEISRSLEDYGEQDASFLLAHHVLGNGQSQRCAELCRILRQYTNIRDTHISAGVRLVARMEPSAGVKPPNIFIFVIDSMRPDYLGVYNPEHVHYTPNLDALARDSVVFHHAYTNYAGTSLSEPAIWAGALLPHTHFPQPFDEVNSLLRLGRTDGYQLVASYDSVLRQLFSPADHMTLLDADKPLWNQYEVCSTVTQLDAALDSPTHKNLPVLFYAQPMNVHQFARNSVPSPSSQNWHTPPGMNPRITYEVHWVDACLGQFFSSLKRRGMYDDSIIIVASDHGDATGEFGRVSHSTSIWPEIIRVPLIVHLPIKMRARMVYDDSRIATLTDIAPTLYYLLGHRPIQKNPLYGRPLFAETRQELAQYPQKDLLLASDVRAVYGILSADGRYLYTTYDSPAQSYLFDLDQDPNAEHSILTGPLKQRYDEEIIEDLQMVSGYYGYKPRVGSLVASVK